MIIRFQANHQLNPIGHSRIDITYNLTNTDCSTYHFNKIDEFSIEKLKVFLSKLEDDIFITGITYDDQDPDNEEPDFAPKHGYWGPYIY